jgi:hypothetical protein
LLMRFFRFFNPCSGACGTCGCSDRWLWRSSFRIRVPRAEMQSCQVPVEVPVHVPWPGKDMSSEFVYARKTIARNPRRNTPISHRRDRRHSARV